MEIRYQSKELYHFGVLGMKWGRRIHSSAASAGNRDAADLRKHGYKEEADAVQMVADDHAKKAHELDVKIKAKEALMRDAKDKVKELKLADTEPKKITVGKAAAYLALGTIGTMVVSNLVSDAVLKAKF